MNIKLEIFAENPHELLSALAHLAGSTAVIKPAATDPAPEAKPEPEAPKKAPGRPKSNVVSIADAKKAEPVKEPEAEQPADDKADEPELPLDAAPAEEQPVEDPKADAKAADLAEALEAAPKVELTQDLVRKFAVKFANDAAKAVVDPHAGDAAVQNEARKVFQSLIKQFGVEKFTEIPLDKMADVHKWVTEQREARKLPVRDIATLV